MSQIVNEKLHFESHPSPFTSEKTHKSYTFSSTRKNTYNLHEHHKLKFKKIHNTTFLPIKLSSLQKYKCFTHFWSTYYKMFLFTTNMQTYFAPSIK